MFLWLAGTPWLRRDSSKMSREICLKETLRDPVIVIVIVWTLWKWAFVSPWHLTQEEDQRKPEPIGDIHRVALIGHQQPPLSVSRVKHYPRVLSETTGKQCIIVPAPLLTRYLLMPLSHVQHSLVTVFTIDIITAVTGSLNVQVEGRGGVNVLTNGPRVTFS